MLSLLNQLVTTQAQSDVSGQPINAKERLAHLRDLRFGLNEQSEEICHMFVQKGGIKFLADIISN